MSRHAAKSMKLSGRTVHFSKGMLNLLPDKYNSLENIKHDYIQLCVISSHNLWTFLDIRTGKMLDYNWNLVNLKLMYEFFQQEGRVKKLSY
jgi:hypothetical protein